MDCGVAALLEVTGLGGVAGAARMACVGITGPATIGLSGALAAASAGPT